MDEKPEELCDCDMPTELQVRDCEFWQLYYYWYESDHFSRDILASGLHEPTQYGVYTEAHEVELYGYWDHWGMRLEIVPFSQSDSVEALWDKHKEQLKETFPEYEIDYEKCSKYKSKITIQIARTSIDILLVADPSWKTEFAETIYDTIHKACGLCEEFVS
jgi:hypothetical protein